MEGGRDGGGRVLSLETINSIYKYLLFFPEMWCLHHTKKINKNKNKETKMNVDAVRNRAMIGP